MALYLPRSLHDALCAHGEEEYPRECCGALLGRATKNGWEIVAALRAENAAGGDPRSHYEIAPAQLVRIVREARRQELEIAGFYHSHPDHPAQWSATDLAEAHWIGASYVIAEVTQGKAAQTRSFRLDGTTEEDKRFLDEQIVVVGS